MLPRPTNEGAMSSLRKWLGPSREEIWRRLAAELGSDYVEGGFVKSGQVRVSHGEWTITLDAYFSAASKSAYTRLRAPFVNPEGFRFAVYRRGLFTDLAKRLGLRDVEVGDLDFDRDFVVQGNDDDKLRQLFASSRLRELLAAQPRVRLTLQDERGSFGKREHPEGTDDLCFAVPGVIKDIDRLARLFALLAETLDQLCRLGAAYEAAYEGAPGSAEPAAT
jgi:hypothetical protein